jgi:hypothetical protein
MRLLRALRLGIAALGVAAFAIVVPAAVILLVLAGCVSTPVATPPALHPLDEQHAAEFRQAFDGAATQPRYIVALSPT